jgi:hypothetical protein
MLVVVLLALLIPEMIRRIWRAVARFQERHDNSNRGEAA